MHPKIVSTRVVNTSIAAWSGTANATSAPTLLPIQLRCIVVTRSGHSVRPSSPSSRSWANAVILKAHSGMTFSTTSDSHRSQWSSTTCSFAMTVLQPVHQFALPSRRYTIPRSSMRRKNHWFQR